MERSSIDWKRMAVSTAITGLVTIFTGVVLFRVQATEPKLVYDVVDSASFEGTGQYFAIYNVSIVNAGTKPATDLRSVIRIPRATLLDIGLVAEPTLYHTYDVTGDTLELRAKELTPNDRIGIFLLATSDSTLPEMPQVFIRGEGVTGIGRAGRQGFLDCWRHLR